MKKNQNISSDADLLRRQAVDRYKSAGKQKSGPVTEIEQKRLIQELQIHQIELEIQNEELQKSWSDLEEVVHKYTELYEFAPAGYFTIARNGTILEVNLAGSIMLEVNRSKLINRRFDSFISEDSVLIFADMMRRVFERKEKAGCEISILANSSGVRYVDVKATANENGQKCLLALLDVTDRKTAELKLEKVAGELRELNQNREKLFSLIAHDLKAPFQGLLGYSEIFSQGVADQDFESLANSGQKIDIIVKRLYELIENLVDWFVLQRTERKISPEKISFCQITDDVIELYSFKLEEKRLQVDNKIPKNSLIFADPRHMNTIMRNLFQNACKFTPKEGKITIDAKPAGPMLEVSVSDTGIGIPKGIREAIFSQERSRIRKGTEGESSTGLGLLLCKEFAELNGGTIRFETKENEGTTFYFTVPSAQ